MASSGSLVQVAKVDAGKESLENLRPCYQAGVVAFQKLDKNLTFAICCIAAQRYTERIDNTITAVTQVISCQEVLSSFFGLLPDERTVHEKKGLRCHTAGGAGSRHEIGIGKVKYLHHVSQRVSEDWCVETASGTFKLIAVFDSGAWSNGGTIHFFVKLMTGGKD